MDDLPSTGSRDPSHDSAHFRAGVVWNFGSLLVLAVSGLALNVLIGRVYDAATLGVFNQVLATYIVFSMFAVGGVNLSVLKRVAEAPEDAERVRALTMAALLVTLMCTTLVSLLYLVVRFPIARWLDSGGVAVGMLWITPGLFCFGINKTLLSLINGQHRMRTFALCQALRYLGLLLGFGLAVALQFPGDRLACVFSFSEAVLLLTLLVILRPHWWPLPATAWRSWLAPHLRFGLKGMFSGALQELNSRVDVLMLGYFLADRQTGIYSFAAFVYEGFLQLGVVLQNNYNPRLSAALHGGHREALEAMFRRGRATTYRWALLVAPLLILLYPLGLRIVFARQPEFMESWLPFVILLAGLTCAAGYVPFQQILVMGDRPGWHTGFILFTAATNIALAYLLIPTFGMTGAALAAALTLVGANLPLILLARWQLGVRLL